MKNSNFSLLDKKLWKTLATPLLIALVLLALYGAVLRHSYNASIDAKIFYMAGKAFLWGGDPYDPVTEQALVAKYAPDEAPSALLTYNYVPPPITSILFALPALLPWPLFWALMTTVNIVCIPLSAFLILRFWGEPTTKQLWLFSFFIALLPPSWQCLRLGQIVFPILFFSLLTAHLFYRNQFRSAGIFALLAMLKPTVCAPMLAYLFLRGDRRARVTLLLMAVAYVAINALGALRLEMQGINFWETYQRSLSLSFGPGGINDPALTTIIRLDIKAILVSLGLNEDSPLKLAATLALTGLFVWFMRKRFGRESQFLFGGAVMTMLLLALFVFYHRSYDALILAGIFSYGFAYWQFLRSGQATKNSVASWFSLALLAVILLCLSSVGAQQNNILNLVLRPFGLEQPVWFKAVCVLVAYGFLIVILRQHAQEDLTRGEKA